MVSLKHKFVSAKADGPDSTRLRPSNWNDEHDLTTAADGVVLGRAAGAGPGDVTEIPMANLLPAGIVLPFAGSVAPTNWAFPYGQTYNRAANPRLFAAIGTTYGVGDGSTTANLPDMRGVVPAGKVNMGGSDRGILSGGGTLGAFLGSQANATSVSISGSASGSMGVSVSGNTNAESQGFVAAAVSGGGAAQWQHTHAFTGTGSASGTLSVSGSGGSAAFSIVQPSIVLNYIINLG